MEGSKTLVCRSEFPWARGRIYSKFVGNLGTRPQNVSPALVYGLNLVLTLIFKLRGKMPRTCLIVCDCTTYKGRSSSCKFDGWSRNFNTKQSIACTRSCAINISRLAHGVMTPAYVINKSNRTFPAKQPAKVERQEKRRRLALPVLMRGNSDRLLTLFTL